MKIRAGEKLEGLCSSEAEAEDANCAVIFSDHKIERKEEKCDAVKGSGTIFVKLFLLRRH